MGTDELALAIASEDIARLSRVPGIGKKTAERLVLELKGKIGSLPSVPGAVRLTAPEVVGGRGDLLACLAGAGLQRARSRIGYERTASRCRCIARHQAGAEATGPALSAGGLQPSTMAQA